MSSAFHQAIVVTGRLPLFCFLVCTIIGFVGIRFSTRMIRANVRWWPGNVTPGGLHIHHAVFGVVLMLVGSVTGLAVPVGSTAWRSIAAGVLGIGSALVLDEFALILQLRDVYWSKEGRTSIDAVFVAIAVAGLLVIGVRPAGLEDFVEASTEDSVAQWVFAVLLTLFNVVLGLVTVIKGKFLTALLGVFFPLFLMVGAVRLARPGSLWARWRYAGTDDTPSAKLIRAQRRERVREPIARAGVWLSELVAGRPDPAPPGPDTRAGG